MASPLLKNRVKNVEPSPQVTKTTAANSFKLIRKNKISKNTVTVTPKVAFNVPTQPTYKAPTTTSSQQHTIDPIAEIKWSNDPTATTWKYLKTMDQEQNTRKRRAFIQQLTKSRFLNDSEITKITYWELFLSKREDKEAFQSEPAVEAAELKDLFTNYIESKTASDLKEGINEDISAVEIHTDIIAYLDQEASLEVKSSLISDLTSKHRQLRQLSAVFPEAQVNQR